LQFFINKEEEKNDYMKKFILFSLVTMLLFSVGTLYSQGFQESAHGNKRNLPKGCGSCHKGHGMSNTAMLPDQKNLFCFRCHGDFDERTNMKQKGFLAKDVDLVNIKQVFAKPYHHPIEDIGIHKYDEILPEMDSAMPRHCECGDCHHHHNVTQTNKTIGITGTSIQGAKVIQISSEYELCLKCHSYSANLPGDQTNKAEQFSLSNPSYHPIIGPGKNHNVPSLIQPASESNTIKCTDCHNNNDGPQGPHGSAYRHILGKNFKQEDGPEGSFEYELCYHCHSRINILSNRSFIFHNLHITIAGTSCRTCHNPHGSVRYTHLIDLDNTSIRASSSGRLEYIDYGKNAGQCFLTCHDKDHNPASYPGTVSDSSKLVPASLTPTDRRR
jgi:predicted CXXCH cytochrome family protein